MENETTQSLKDKYGPVPASVDDMPISDGENRIRKGLSLGEYRKFLDFCTHLREIVQPKPNLQLCKEPQKRAEYLALIWKNIPIGMSLPAIDKSILNNMLVDEIYGLGPIQPLLENDDFNEIMVNAYNRIYVEKRGKLEKAPVRFYDDDHVLNLMQSIAHYSEREINHKYPLMDARLPGGSRVNAVIPPQTLQGPTLTIRKFNKIPLTINDMISSRIMTEQTAEFLHQCVLGRLNILISGGTGTGKTTMLNILSTFIPDQERIVTIEDAAELQLNKEHVITMESRPPSVYGEPPITIQQLVINALRMRPDRIVVGEVRGGEAMDMLQAMNTGHDGSMTTGHGNSSRDMLARLETMVMMAGYDMPLMAIRQQITSAIHMIVHMARLSDGRRIISKIIEITGMEGMMITSGEIFKWNGEKLIPTGVRPAFSELLAEKGIKLSPDTFISS